MRSLVLSVAICLTTLNVHSQKITLDSSVAAKRYRFTTRQLQVPLTLSLMGIFASSNSKGSVKNMIVKQRNEHLANFNTDIDDYLLYSPIPLIYGLEALGVPARTDVANRTAILVKGEILALGTSCLIKTFSRQMRPDNTTRNSFPSGHTVQVFATATMLSMEYKDELPWMPYAAYGLASSVGLMRMANNRHYISDVLLGAGIGILSMKASYWTHKYIWKKKPQPVLY